jgi:hypothetical protein
MPKKRTQNQLPILQPDAAGIDVAAKEIFVAVPADCDPEPVRCFRTFTQNKSSKDESSRRDYTKWLSTMRYNKYSDSKISITQIRVMDTEAILSRHCPAAQRIV